MTTRAAQIGFIALTVLFLAAAMTLFLTNIAILAGVFCLLVAFIGFIVFMAMLVSDVMKAQQGQ